VIAIDQIGHVFFGTEMGNGCRLIRVFREPAQTIITVSLDF
jgi:hypothetical protein